MAKLLASPLRTCLVPALLLVALLLGACGGSEARVEANMVALAPLLEIEGAEFGAPSHLHECAGDGCPLGPNTTRTVLAFELTEARATFIDRVRSIPGWEVVRESDCVETGLGCVPGGQSIEINGPTHNIYITFEGQAGEVSARPGSVSYVPPKDAPTTTSASLP